MLVPSERTAIFPATNAPALVAASEHEPPGVTGFWTPTERDIEGLEDNLSSYLLKIRMAHPIEIDRRMPEWSRFHRQIAGITVGEKRMLFIAYSSFSETLSNYRSEPASSGKPHDPKWWKSLPIQSVVFDGGIDYFRVIYDLSERRFIWYDENISP